MACIEHDPTGAGKRKGVSLSIDTGVAAATPTWHRLVPRRTTIIAAFDMLLSGV